jgi:hypothetical protein
MRKTRVRFDSGFRIPDSIPDPDSGFQIPDSIPDSGFRIPDSGFPFQIPDSRRESLNPDLDSGIGRLPSIAAKLAQ